MLIYNRTPSLQIPIREVQMVRAIAKGIANGLARICYQILPGTFMVVILRWLTNMEINNAWLDEMMKMDG